MVRHLVIFDHLIRHYGIPEGFRALDLGCKYGDLVCLLRKRNVNIIGLDINKKAIEDGKRKFNLAEDVLLHGDARNLSQFKPESFDIVVAYGVLEHIPEFEKVFANVFRILKKGGYSMWVYQTDGGFVKDTFPYILLIGYHLVSREECISECLTRMVKNGMLIFLR